MRYLATLATFFLLSSLALSQEFRATLTGRITDPAGAPVPGAVISVRNPQTGESTTTKSGDDGTYQVSFLTPGNYVVTVEKTGFKKVNREGVTLDVAERAVVDIPLSVGDVTQSVTVAANAETLETQSADRGLTIDSSRVLDVPLMGRNPFAAAWSAPGVIQDASTQRLRPFDIAGSSSMAIDGGRPSTNEVLVDGVTSLLEASSVSYVPTAEAVSEFKVQTTNFDAQYGWTLGGVVNMITKNGTNQFHGSLFEFLQNTHLDANTFNSNLTGVRRQESHINTFGGDIGGPIRKNKLFFTYTFEDIRQVIPDPFALPFRRPCRSRGISPRLTMRGTARAIRWSRPFTIRSRQRLRWYGRRSPGNIIPTSRLDPVAVKVFSYVPAGNVAGDPLTGLNNLTNNASTRHFTDYFPENTGRVDYDINQWTRLFVRYSRNALQEERSFHYSTNSAHQSRGYRQEQSVHARKSQRDHPVH